MHLGDELVIADGYLLQVFGKAHGVADVVDAQKNGKIAGRAHLVHAAQALLKGIPCSFQLFCSLGNGQIFLFKVAFAHFDILLQSGKLRAQRVGELLVIQLCLLRVFFACLAVLYLLVQGGYLFAQALYLFSGRLIVCKRARKRGQHQCCQRQKRQHSAHSAHQFFLSCHGRFPFVTLSDACGC